MAESTKMVQEQCQRQGCRAFLSPQELHRSQSERTILLCDNCLPWYKEQLAKCAPLFSKIGL